MKAMVAHLSVVVVLAMVAAIVLVVVVDIIK
jgi:hypothetical protein